MTMPYQEGVHVAGFVTIRGVKKSVDIGGVEGDGGLDPTTYNSVYARIFNRYPWKKQFIVETNLGAIRIFRKPNPRRTFTLWR